MSSFGGLDYWENFDLLYREFCEKSKIFGKKLFFEYFSKNNLLLVDTYLDFLAGGKEAYSFTGWKG